MMTLYQEPQENSSLRAHAHGALRYWSKGTSPTVLILSGMHGNEYEVSECVTDYVFKNEKNLPDFLFIPQVSPSAISKKTRTNAYGHDLNRSFHADTQDSEALVIMEVLEQHAFHLCIDFHEDPDREKSFYMYDTDVLDEDNLTILRNHLRETDVRLYTGIDDEYDVDLGLYIKQGYISTPVSQKPEDQAGFLTQWLIPRKRARRMITPEIPGKAQKEKKYELVAALFSFFIPFVSRVYGTI